MYASDRMEQKKQQQKLYKQAVERRLAKANGTAPKKKDPNADLVQKRKETGYIGG